MDLSLSLSKYFLLLKIFSAEFYPCKECGSHFKKLLEENPPDTRDRKRFAMYMCDMHNKVNERLNKEIFDCSTLYDEWGGDCGCGDDEGNWEESRKFNFK